MVSRAFLIAVKLHPRPAYKLAQAAGLHPVTLSKLMTGAEPHKENDERIIAIGQLVGLKAEECFEQ